MSYHRGNHVPSKKLRLIQLGKTDLWHFKNAAAKTRAKQLYGENLERMQKFDASFFKLSKLVHCTHAHVVPKNDKSQVRQSVDKLFAAFSRAAKFVVVGRTKAERAERTALDRQSALNDAANITKGRGFRIPSSKPEYGQGPRAEAKREAREEMKAKILSDREAA